MDHGVQITEFSCGFLRVAGNHCVIPWVIDCLMMATPRMRWKHCSRARQLVWSDKLQSHPDSPIFWIAQWFGLPDTKKVTEKGSCLLWNSVCFCFYFNCFKVQWSKWASSGEDFYSPESQCRWLLPHELADGALSLRNGLGARLGWQKCFSSNILNDAEIQGI